MTMDALIIGGSRNLGHFLAHRMLASGYRVTVLNRGISPNDLPEDVAHLQCDRTDINQLRRALNGRTFDIVVDNVVFNGQEAESIVDVLNGQIKHYFFISTGQVYLVRDGIERPFVEDDYEGDILPVPQEGTYDYEEYMYGAHKRDAEDVFARAFANEGFPFTSLRLPMVNSERDHFNRLYSYYLRIQDGGPVLVPDYPDYPLRHVYVGDVVEAIMILFQNGTGKGQAYNISQDETVSIKDFLKLLANIMGTSVDVVTIDRKKLEAGGFLPDCSPFSDLWMSELDNTHSKVKAGITYTPLRDYLERIVTHYRENPAEPPRSYRRRHKEKELAASIEKH